MERIVLYCKCGAQVRAFASADLLRFVKRWWRKNHLGHGHGKCDCQQAAKARYLKNLGPEKRRECNRRYIKTYRHKLGPERVREMDRSYDRKRNRRKRKVMQ